MSVQPIEQQPLSVTEARALTDRIRQTLDPVVLQCGDCGTTTTQPDGQGAALFIILARYLFHRCEQDSPRRCPACLAVVHAACDRPHGGDS